MASPPAWPRTEDIEVEGLGLDALAEEVLVRGLTRSYTAISARMGEHLTDEERKRWVLEEAARLSPQYPEGVPEDVLAEAYRARIRRECPRAL